MFVRPATTSRVLSLHVSGTPSRTCFANNRRGRLAPWSGTSRGVSRYPAGIATLTPLPSNPSPPFPPDPVRRPGSILAQSTTSVSQSLSTLYGYISTSLRLDTWYPAQGRLPR
ncbi:hypothetical protein L249_5818, partial [Ophiocordyceps polyrhachis-furcata BCC 54312]